MSETYHLVFHQVSLDRLLKVWKRLKSERPVDVQDLSIEHALTLHKSCYSLYDELFANPQSNPEFLEHLAFHVAIASQISLKSPPEAETFYRVRLRKHETAHEAIHFMILLYQSALTQAGTDAQQILPLYVEGLKKNLKRFFDRRKYI